LVPRLNPAAKNLWAPLSKGKGKRRKSMAAPHSKAKLQNAWAKALTKPIKNIVH
jgi:hypothetical protein